eukprot:m.95384 g.95384  ORF g.95384 m.95384 type:complete len:308 (-) comp16592_c0_seq4:338-1261(-)
MVTFLNIGALHFYFASVYSLFQSLTEFCGCFCFPMVLRSSRFIPHGAGPMPLLGDPRHNQLAAFFRDLVQMYVKDTPKAILMITSHWEADPAQNGPCVTTSETPELYFDYYGFPDAAYSITYKAKGSPNVAEQVLGRLRLAGFDGAHGDPERGWDHGVFVPAKLIVPAGTIPIVQMSLMGALDADAHLRLGRALEPLRSDGVLVLGSGMSFHSMPAFLGTPSADILEKACVFDSWLNDMCTKASREDRERGLRDWKNVPGAVDCHPREEHLLSLHVVVGAAGDGSGSRIYFEPKFFGKFPVSGWLFQ